MTDETQDLNPQAEESAPAAESLETPAEEATPAAEEAMPVETDADLDIGAALAAVASLHEVVAPPPEEETYEESVVEAPAPSTESAPKYIFPAPPLTALPRGSLGSVVPALLLIAIGAWLTFTLSTAETPPDNGLIAAVALGGVALTLLARWLASGRWARGVLFFASALLFAAIVLGYLVLSGATQHWTLMISALGAAFIVTALFARPRENRLLFPGVLLVAGGLVGLASDFLPAEVLAIAQSLWFVPLILLAILWLLPVLRRR